MRLNLLIADFAYVGKQRVCLFEGVSPTESGEVRGVVGRLPSCRMLIEGDQSVSREHFQVLFVGGRFWIRNLSRGGTRIVNKQDLMEVGAKVILENNDRIQIGETELLATILPSPVSRAVGSHAASIRKGPVAPEPGAPPDRASSARNADPELAVLHAMAARSAQAMPKTSQIMSVPMSDTGEGDSAEPGVAPVRLPAAAKPAQRRHEIPDDLDLELLLGMAPSSSTRPQKSDEAVAATRKRPTARTQAISDAAASAPAKPADQRARSAPAGGSATLWLELLIAAGVDPERAQSLQHKLSAAILGDLLGTLVSALSAQLMVRDSFKRTFRLATTEVRSAGNNPLKLPTSTGDVIADLLEPPQGFLGSSDAVRDAALELQVHQAAVAECIRSSFESLVDFLDPAKVENDAERGSRSLLSHLSGGRDASSWKMYRELYQRNFGDRHRAFLTIYLERFGHDYESATNRVKSGTNKKSTDRKKGK